ncbi:MAG: SsrA-binding protein SmpB [Myxococcales bacterium]|nr:SsrA-binding protein SmpB [Myxococcales bacterium]MCB9709011.1 SsrA-binding protein SmpB [Myxococcales bacterium]
MANSASKKQAKSGELLVCSNPLARRNYEIEDTYEAGMMLLGSETKSLRARKASLEGAYATFRTGQLFLNKMYIAPYEQATAFAHEPLRERKLLMHRHQLEKLQGRLTIRGYSLVPLRVYFKNRFAKVELGLGKGRTKGDKRQQVKRDIDRREARDAMQKYRR